MPLYDYHCNHCGREVALYFKTYADYDTAEKRCTHCGSVELTRVIRGVALQPGAHNYQKMTSSEMLSVLESGRSEDVNAMYRQLGADPDGLARQAKDIQKASQSGASASETRTAPPSE